MSLTVIVPSKGRPLNAARLIEAVDQTAGDELQDLVIAIDRDEPLEAEYRAAVPRDGDTTAWAWVRVRKLRAEPQRMGPVLNVAASTWVECSDYVGFMGDDHLPRTPGWDLELVTALNGRPGVAYGNDLHQGERLPTACVISSDIVRALGYMCPPAQMHLYLDDFWRRLGLLVGNLAYASDVVIEHLHPNAGKARWDEGYAATNNADQYNADRVAYEALDWNEVRCRLREAGIACD